MSAREDQRALLLRAARRTIEAEGVSALRTRTLTAEVGTSTQAIYTLFGGMPGVLEALGAEGYTEMGEWVQRTPDTEDAVADFFACGGAYAGWALTHPGLYRFMFTMAGTLRDHPAGQASFGVMIRSVQRVVDAGRVRPVDAELAAGQFLAATHGWLLIQMADGFGPERGLEVMTALSLNLMVGLGDERAMAERSLQRALAAVSAGA